MSTRMRRALRIAQWIPVTLILIAMAACAPLPPRNPIATWVPSKNYDIRKPQLIEAIEEYARRHRRFGGV